jgi:anti-sigma regulatory factor (Ser/Thr protein kinase)
MVIAEAESMSLVAITLPGTLCSAQMARFYVRAALGCHDLGEFAGDVEMVASELVSNAVTHAGARVFGLELLSTKDGSGVMVVVTDSCPLLPVMSVLTEDAECGRGLRVVEALSACWGWAPQDPGKAVFAIFTREG